jgi:probable HAF family extracellular repeat protein
MSRTKCALIAAVVWVAGAARGQVQYTVTDLGPGVYPNGINSAGHVAAMRSTGNQDEALVWDGTLRSLGISGFSRAWDINDAGTVAIQLGTPGVPAAHDGTLRQLGTLGGTYGASMGINNAGGVVGLAATPNDAASHAFLYRNGQMTDLGTLAAGQNSLANDVNDAGVVVGRSAINPPGPEVHHAFLWDGTMHDLGRCPRTRGRRRGR